VKLALTCHYLHELVVHGLDISECLLQQLLGVLTLVLLKLNFPLLIITLLYILDFSEGILTFFVLGVHLVS
jgi:hypothetical protein